MGGKNIADKLFEEDTLHMHNDRNNIKYNDSFFFLLIIKIYFQYHLDLLLMNASKKFNLTIKFICSPAVCIVFK